MSEEFADGVTTPEEKQEGKEFSDSVETKEQEQKNYLSQFVGDDKPYKTVEEAAEALAKKAINADPFIEQLKGEVADYRSKYEELSTRNRSVDEILEAIKQGGETTQEERKQVEEQTPLNMEDILAKIDEREQQKTAAQTKKQKIQESWGKLGEAFEGKEKELVAKYIGGSEDKKKLVNNLALTDPDALIQILKPLGNDEQFGGGHEGRSTDINPIPQGKLTWDTVRKVRKENPKLYKSHAFKQRMHKELD